MNIGTIITRALNRAQLSAIDIGYRDMAFEMLDEIIHEHWNSQYWKFRKRSLTLTTVAAQEEYSLDKRVDDISAIVPNTMRGASPVRTLIYEPAHEFYRTHAYDLPSGAPYRYRECQVKGFATDPTAASLIAFVSSQANYTTGTVRVVEGSKQVVFGGGASITLDMISRWLRVGTDTKTYRLVSRDYNSTTTYYLNEPYEGVSAAAATFALGDIQQKCAVTGYVSGQLMDEEVQLNGASSISTTKSFTSLVRIAKSDKTAGYVTATSNVGVVTNIVLDPGETEAEYLTIKLCPIPTAVEILSYEAYIQHPWLYKNNDSTLFPNQYHNVLLLDLFIKLETEWNRREPSPSVYARRDALLKRMIEIDNSTDGWSILQESEEEADRLKIDNLPAMYGYDDEF